MNAKIFPSLISGNLLNLEKEIRELEKLSDGFHIDIMDGHFVPNLTWGPSFIHAIAEATKKPLFIHLMVSNPQDYLEKIRYRKQDFFCFHLEALGDYTSQEVIAFISKIKKQGTKASIALKPSTPIEKITPFISSCDDILLMSVEPGFSGQPFLEISYNRLKELESLKHTYKAPTTISMDGGITASNIKILTAHGASIFAIASAIFSHDDPIIAMKILKENCC